MTIKYNKKIIFMMALLSLKVEAAFDISNSTIDRSIDSSTIITNADLNSRLLSFLDSKDLKEFALTNKAKSSDKLHNDVFLGRRAQEYGLLEETGVEFLRYLQDKWITLDKSQRDRVLQRDDINKLILWEQINAARRKIFDEVIMKLFLDNTIPLEEQLRRFGMKKQLSDRELSTISHTIQQFSNILASSSTSKDELIRSVAHYFSHHAADFPKGGLCVSSSDLSQTDCYQLSGSMEMKWRTQIVPNSSSHITIRFEPATYLYVDFQDCTANEMGRKMSYGFCNISYELMPEIFEVIDRIMQPVFERLRTAKFELSEELAAGRRIEVKKISDLHL